MRSSLTARGALLGTALLLGVWLPGLSARSAQAQPAPPAACQPVAPTARVNVTLARRTTLNQLLGWISRLTCQRFEVAAGLGQRPVLLVSPPEISGAQVPQLLRQALRLMQLRQRPRAGIRVIEERSASVPAPAAAPAGAHELVAGVRSTDATHYTLERRVMDGLLSHQSVLLRSVRVVPHQQDGKVVGVKLFGIRAGSLLGAMGLQNGDTLHTVNGLDASSPARALETYTRLRTASVLTVALTRRGAPLTLEYRIVPDAGSGPAGAP